jgi:hypothetical protein
MKIKITVPEKISIYIQDISEAELSEIIHVLDYDRNTDAVATLYTHLIAARQMISNGR